MKSFSKKELAWIKRLQKTIDSIPETLQVFDSESGIAIYKAKELPTTKYLTVDSSVEHKIVKTKQWSAGAW